MTTKSTSILLHQEEMTGGMTLTDELQHLSERLEEALQQDRWRRQDYIQAMTIREYPGDTYEGTLLLHKLQ